MYFSTISDPWIPWELIKEEVESSVGQCESLCKSSKWHYWRNDTLRNIKSTIIEKERSPRSRVTIQPVLPRSVPYLALTVSWETPQSQANQEVWSSIPGKLKCRLGMCDRIPTVLKVSRLPDPFYVCFYLYFFEFLPYSGIWDQKYLLSSLYFSSTCKIKGYKRGKGWELCSFLNVFIYTFNHLKFLWNSYLKFIF